MKQRRNLLDNKLNNYKQEKLKRKLPKDGQLLEYAKEDIEMKKQLVNHIEIMEEHYQDNMAKMSANTVLVLDFLFYKDCLYLNKICFHSSKCVVCCPCQLLLIFIVPILNMSLKLLKSQVCENMANPI